MPAGRLEALPESLEVVRKVLEGGRMRSTEKVVHQDSKHMVEARVLLAEEEVVAWLAGLLWCGVN